jgi:hypothetical protein
MLLRIINQQTARNYYKEEVSKDIAVLKIMMEKYATNPDVALRNLKEDPYSAYKFISDFYTFGTVLDQSMANYLKSLTSTANEKKYYTTSLGLSMIQDTLEAIYTDNYVNLSKYQFDSNDVGNEYDVFGTNQAFYNDGTYNSPIVFNKELVRKYKPLKVEFYHSPIFTNYQEIGVLLKKLSVSEIITLFFNLVTKAPIIEV